MIARWRDQLDRQIIVFVAFYVGNKKFPQKLLSRWRRVSTSSSSWTAPRPPGRRSSPYCKSMFSHVGLSWTISLHKDRSWFGKREHYQNVKIPFDGIKHMVDENERHDWPLWDVLGGITLLGDLVVDKSKLATLLSGRDSVQADVELGTVVRVRVPLRIRSCLGRPFSPSWTLNFYWLPTYLGWGSNWPNSSVGAFSGQVNPLLVSEVHNLDIGFQNMQIIV